jgi:endonuclease G
MLRTAGRSEAALFDRYANQTGNRANGVNLTATLAQLPEIIKNEAIVHQDDTVAFGFLLKALVVARSVAKVSVPRFDSGQQRMIANGRPWIMNGTGWLIGRDLIITNHHVINARETGEAPAASNDLDKQSIGVSVLFDFDSDGSPTENLSVSKLEVADPKLDYAILRLHKIPTNRQPLSSSMQDPTMTPTSYVPMNIIQHPRGLPKRIAFRNNLLSGCELDSFRYFTDTDFGSSGSPVCDDAWRVVGLHRGAQQVSGVKFQGKDTAFINFGTPINRLLLDLKQRSSSIHAEILACKPVDNQT